MIIIITITILYIVNKIKLRGINNRVYYDKNVN